jgi:thiol-disulfide isomerase/thioredoxin
MATAGVLALAGLVVGCGGRQPGEAPAAHAVEEAGAQCPADAPPASFDFTLKDVDEKPVDLASFKGKVVLLDFWATWCGPCKVEIPWFIEFQERYGAQGFQVVGVSVDDKPEQLKPYVADMKMNYPVLQGLGHDDLMDAFGPILGIPVSTIISREGKICARHTGLSSKEVIEEQIRALL